MDRFSTIVLSIQEGAPVTQQNTGAGDIITYISLGIALAAVVFGPLIQLYIAKRQIVAKVVSTNRQDWINLLRKNLTSFLSNANACVRLHRDNTGVSEKARTHTERAQTKFEHIRLMLNPNETKHQKLVKHLQHVVSRIDLPHDEVITFNFSDARSEIVDLAQEILKEEWVRVKRGE